MNAAPRLRVGLIGAGRVGIPLARALQSAEHPVVAAHATSEASIARVQRWLPATDLATIPAVVAASDAVLIAVPDDELASIISGIAQTSGFRSGQFVIHSSGRYGLDVLEPAIAQGAIGIALHPAMTFTGSATDIDRLKSCPFAVTTRDEWRPAAEALVLEMGGEPFRLDDAERTKYHAALSHASNHLNTLLTQSVELLSAAGIHNAGGFLEPLVQASAENALSLGVASLTGPISRGDVETVRQHVSALATSSMFPTYRQLALATIDNALRANRIAVDVAAQLREVLG